MPEQSYLVHSMVRSAATRMQRAVAPQHHRLVQRLAGGEIVVRRMRPATITEAKLYKHLEELRRAEKEGKIKVTTGRGQPVDLSSLSVLPAKVESKPLPKPPLDSVTNDRTYGTGVGVAMPQHLRGSTATGASGVPTTLAKLKEDSETAPVKVAGDPALARKTLELAAAKAAELESEAAVSLIPVEDPEDPEEPEDTDEDTED